MDEEQKITEAETEKVTEENEIAPEMSEKAKRNDFYIELALFLILGVLVGIAVKTEAVKRITIGFEDYKIASEAQYYNINNLDEELKAKRANELKAADQQTQEQAPTDETQGVTDENTGATAESQPATPDENSNSQ